MCNERERLIEYVYDECAPDDRATVHAHLTACRTCREEIGALRSVRDDLLAWRVPEHESVWRPLAPARMLPSWRDVSAWALAAAAGIIFMVGLAGGIAARGWLPSVATATSAASTAPEATPTVTAADLDRLEERLRAELEARTSALDQRVQVLTSSTATAARPAVAQLDAQTLRDLRIRMERIEALSRDQALINVELDNRIGRFLNLSTRGGRSDMLQPVVFGGPVAR